MSDPLEDALRAELGRVAAATPIPPLPTGATSVPIRSQAARGSRRRRWYGVAAAAAGIAVVGVPVAAAAGGPPVVRDAFGWSHSPSSGLTATSTNGSLAGTVPSAADLPVQISTSPAVGGGLCFNASVARPTGGSANTTTSGCMNSQAMPKRLAEVGSAGSDKGILAVVYAPGSTHVDVAYGGVTTNIPVVDDLSAAWVPPNEFYRPVDAISYDAAGTETGHVQLVEGTDPAKFPPAPSGIRVKRAATSGSGS